MTAPERIWAGLRDSERYWTPSPTAASFAEYVRADLLVTTQRELAEARAERDEARKALERDRSLVIVACNEFSDAFARRSWLMEGRGPYEWDDDRYRDEFSVAYDELNEPIKRLQKIGADWSNCPTDPAEIQDARRDWKARAEASDRRIEALEKALRGAKAFHDRDSGCNGFTADYEILRLEIDTALKPDTAEERRDG